MWVLGLPGECSSHIVEDFWIDFDPLFGWVCEFRFNPCRDPELVKRIGAATALEVRATGIQYAFAPCIAVYIQ